MGPYQIRDISLSFDGLDDYVEVPADVWFSGDFTIESWVYLLMFDSCRLNLVLF